MAIGWAHSDGTSGVYDNPSEAVMEQPQISKIEEKTKPVEQTPFEQAHSELNLNQQEKDLYQRHLDNLNGPGGVDNPDGSRSSLYRLSIEHNDKTYNIPSVYGGKILPPKEAVDRAFDVEGIDKFPSYSTREEADQRYQRMHDFMEKDTQKYQGQKSQSSFHEQLASFQQRLDATPPAEASELQKFFGSLNIMPRPGKPQEEWTVKEHLGVMLNTAMAGIGGGYRMPKITGPGIGARPPASFDYPMDFKDYYPANNWNRKGGGQIEPSNLDEFVNNAWEGLRKQFTPGTYEHAVANQIAQKGKLKIVPKEENLTTETIPQLQQAQDQRVNWPEGWGTTKATGRALTEYPHVQKAFKEAVESGAGSISEITDHMNLSGVTINPSTVQLLRKQAGLTGTKSEVWSSEKNDTFMKMIGEGKTTPEISKEMSLTRSTVEGKIRRLREDNPDFERTFATRDTMTTRLDSVRELAKQGLHANAIAEKIGKSSAYVRMLASTGDIELPRDPSSRGGGAPRKSEKGDWQKALQERLNR